MATEIWLIRHGETPWSKTGQHTGRTDLPLTEAGEAEARAAGSRLAGERFEMVLCSPLLRARRTCEIAGYCAQAVFDPDCMEWDYGELNGRTREEYRAEHPGWTIWTGGVPNGEKIEEVAARASRVLDRINGCEGRAVIFAHGHFLRILTAMHLEFVPAAAKNFALATARISVLGRDNGFPAILKWNG